ncbi:RNA methyltransferase, TrmA family [Melioribacter roseus P3M-2]|uniref:RNA methyltransferase, TrmA family n=1 Tax=Melioribacter roseus (strain DSM 23840 / JCM 17771 / VKM B-2668 / P3M-2) TaxID=1191523 RepID=I6ZQN2_MELRP|nr:23S rRNA (uracil(1939)-C(5))-methyltransferase RlmD [Melioribacter roseus]AFN74384.1 RNA methyltransferase, TrmA family [Melioribacter roseus P3M-2]
MKKGDILELEITSYAFEGKGVSKIIKEVNPSEPENSKRYVIFVKGAYPGDLVKARLKKIKKSYAEAEAVAILKKSPYRTEPRCKYFGVCGGCKQQDLDYQVQLKFKSDQVNEIFNHIGGLNDFESLPIAPSEKIFYYRNKMEFSFANKRWLSENEINSMQEIKDKNFALGLHIPGMYDKVLDIDECFLQSEMSNEILNFTRSFFKGKNATIYSTETHTGYLRNLVIKQSFHRKDLMVNLVTSEENPELMKEYSDLIQTNFPAVTTLINNINRKKSQVATGDYEIVLFGSGFIYDTIGEKVFRISANSFFQTNTLQAEKLYRTALEFANMKGDEIVYDLYSGAGTIPIFISENAGYIYGFENVEPAIEDARINIELNKTGNFKPFPTDLNKSFLPIIEENKIPLPDILIADPPRSGMHPKTVNDILSVHPQKIVYISCNPATQARDVKLLCDGGYKLIKIKPVDMFPHTYHIENVALLEYTK